MKVCLTNLKEEEGVSVLIGHTNVWNEWKPQTVNYANSYEHINHRGFSPESVLLS